LVIYAEFYPKTSCSEFSKQILTSKNLKIDNANEKSRELYLIITYLLKFYKRYAKSKPRVKRVVCTGASSAYYRLAPEGAPKVRQLHLILKQPLKRLIFLLTGFCYP